MNPTHDDVVPCNFSLLSLNFCLGLLAFLAVLGVHVICIKFRLRRHGIHSVGVVQSHNIGEHLSLEVVFPVHRKFLVSKKVYAIHDHDCSMESVNKLQGKDPDDWMIVQRSYTISSLEVFNEAVETRRIIVVFDPKSPSHANPACELRLNKSCFSYICSIEMITTTCFVGSALVSCALLLHVVITLLLDIFTKESARQQVFTCLVVITPFVLIAWCYNQTFKQLQSLNKEVHLNGDILEEIAIANSIPFLNNSIKCCILERLVSEDTLEGIQ